ncbi:hypothetical protein OPV22_009673 [Ensete ventricosum]|uniref:Uncharacterized protein n=1 Tax=Ensete ventricosum TaxID=4639 RepID=A0AAV8RJ25_ENSVE|nr:hypothetical protein OPV22_009673 [Ensete ventricosum]
MRCLLAHKHLSLLDSEISSVSGTYSGAYPDGINSMSDTRLGSRVGRGLRRLGHGAYLANTHFIFLSFMSAKSNTRLVHNREQGRTRKMTDKRNRCPHLFRIVHPPKLRSFTRNPSSLKGYGSMAVAKVVGFDWIICFFWGKRLTSQI